ncbi:hypothetical protein [Paracoccus sp. (in: a-proteobacteria)]|uniref:hypothetical protein n=1 Tax=Paracoccus sp. TaxID=267 RepID=UPI003A8C72C0
MPEPWVHLFANMSRAGRIRRKRVRPAGLAAVLLLTSGAAACADMFAARSYRQPVQAMGAGSVPSVNACPQVSPGMLYRFVAGMDQCVTPLSPSELGLINSFFATNVLKKGLAPGNVADIVTYLDQASQPGTRKSFVVGEGGQIPLSIASRDAPRDYRYVVSWGTSALLSAAPGGHSSFLQVISWDETARHFDYFQYMPQIDDQSGADKVWAWAGRSDFAYDSRSRGKGCFDCHTNGTIIMKELETPWNNWNSETASIVSSHVPQAVAAEALFQGSSGAAQLQNLIEGGLNIFHAERIKRNTILDASSHTCTLTGVPDFLHHVTTGTTVNFVSSQVRSAGEEDVPVPLALLFGARLLRETLNVNPDFSGDLSVPRAVYNNFLTQQKYALVQQGRNGPLYTAPGSTYFAAFVPDLSFEDVLVARLLTNEQGCFSVPLIPAKFFAAIAMTDFANPVFSDKRPLLQAYADKIEQGTVSASQNTIVDDFVGAVRQAAGAQAPCDFQGDSANCSAEQQFLGYWDIPGDWRTAYADLVGAYLKNFMGNAGAKTDLLLRAEAVRHQFTQWPTISNLDEFSLLLPEPGAAN